MTPCAGMSRAVAHISGPRMTKPLPVAPLNGRMVERLVRSNSGGTVEVIPQREYRPKGVRKGQSAPSAGTPAGDAPSSDEPKGGEDS